MSNHNGTLQLGLTRPAPDALALEYKREYGTASGDLDGPGQPELTTLRRPVQLSAGCGEPDLNRVGAPGRALLWIRRGKHLGGRLAASSDQPNRGQVVAERQLQLNRHRDRQL